MLLHLIDAYADDVAERYQTIRRELAQYSSELAARPEVVALTKTEGFDDELLAMQKESLREVVPAEVPIFAISSQSRRGIDDVLRRLAAEVAAYRQRQAETEEDEAADDTATVITLSDSKQADHWDVIKDPEESDVFIVSGEKIEKFARRTNFEGHENVNRLRDIMKKMGITHELLRQGASGESIIQIGEARFTLLEQ